MIKPPYLWRGIPAMLAVLVTFSAAAAETSDRTRDDIRQLLDSVKFIASPGVPGTVAAFGEQAFIVASGPSGDRRSGRDRRVPIVAAARHGKGRVVIFGHDGYLTLRPGEGADTGRLLANIARWSADGSGLPVTCAVVGRLTETLKLPAEVAVVRPARSLAEAIKATEPPRIIFTVFSSLRDADSQAVLKYVERGGTLVSGGTGWGWLQLNPGQTLAADHPGNQLLGTIGLAWADGMSGPDENKLIRVEPPRQELLHAGKVIESLRAKQDPALSQAADIVIQAARCAPDNSAFMQQLRGLQTSGTTAMPSEKSPVRAADVLDRILISLAIQESLTLPAEKVRAHRGASIFPGVPPSTAPRVTRSTSVDTSIPRWHSTGLYAAAGEVITVTVPTDAANTGLKVRIGAHTDRLYQHDAWKRIPEIASVWPVKESRMRIASAFGGLIYIDVPEKAARKAVSVEIAGAVEAPLYVRGRTTAEDWRRIRKHPAGWAELATSKIILTVPAEVVREIDDPEPLMAHWDNVMDAVADLAAISRERRSPERIVTDVAISVGYMHSGYPIMTHLDVKQNIVDLKKLKSGESGWGFYHEIGHNHQAKEWTFDGTVEVTCNLFTMYVLEQSCGLAPAEASVRALGPKRQKKIEEYLAKPDFEKWKSDPFLALATYAQLRNAFGWETYKKVFAEYRSLPAAERPQGEQEERDQWMVRFSRATGKNLGPFFEKWGIPTTERARKSIANLPLWTPEAAGQ